MGVTDYGTQEITFQFQEPLKAISFNKLNYEILPTGIYDGGLLTKTSGSIVQISPVSFVIQDSADEVVVNIKTANTVSLTVSAATPFIILRWDFVEVENNYADFLTVSFGELLDDDLIIGRCIYDGGILQDNFDYSRRTKSYLSELKDNNNKLKVYATEPYSTSVYVEGGIIYNSDGFITVTSGTSPAISNTTDGRIDLITIQDDGTINAIEGVDSATPVPPDNQGEIVIAQIERGATKTYITGYDITLVDYMDGLVLSLESQIDINSSVTAEPDTYMLRDANGNSQTRIPTSQPATLGDGDIWVV